MAFENAMLAAITISRLGDMLPLLSISRPTVTGASWLLKKLIVLRPLVFGDAERVLPEAADIAAFAVPHGDVQHDELGLGREIRRESRLLRELRLACQREPVRTRR